MQNEFLQPADKDAPMVHAGKDRQCRPSGQQAENKHQGHRIKQTIPDFQDNQFATENLHFLKNLFAAHVTEHEPQGSRTVEQYADSGAYQRDSSQVSGPAVARVLPLGTRVNAGVWEDERLYAVFAEPPVETPQDSPDFDLSTRQRKAKPRQNRTRE